MPRQQSKSPKKNNQRSTEGKPYGSYYNLSKRSPYNKVKVKKRYFKKAVTFLILVLLIGGATFYALDHNSSSKNSQTLSKVTNPPTTPQATTPSPEAVAAVNMCAGNTLSQYIVVSITDRHMWACEQSKAVYNSAVVTGMENYAADLTPTGTYHIYAKQTNQNLIGSDSTGSWDDFVYYWLPFLHNQYGTYGFHDATWRSASAFGNISPYSNNASHGCVEMPLTTAAWLYNWAQIGTTLTIKA